VRRDEHCLQPNAHGLLKRVTGFQSLPHSRKDRLDVLLRHGSAEGSTSDRRRMLSASDIGLPETTSRQSGSFSFGILCCSESPKRATWLAGSQDSRSSPSASTHCTTRPGPSYLVGTDFLDHGRRGRQIVGDDADAILGLQLRGELDHRGLVHRAPNSSPASAPR